jgi:hypothetical protein
MKKIIFALLTLLMTYSLEAQNQLDQARQETSNFIKSLSTSITADNYKMFGLKSPEDAGQMEAGQVFNSLLVPLNQLKKYDGGDVKPLLTNVNRVSCTIINRQTQQTIGIVDLELQKGLYVAKGYSTSDISTALGRINQELFNKNFSIVRVPALNVYFGSFTDENQMKFVSLQNNSNLHTEIGEIRPADEFLKRLVPMANEYNGLPW